MSTPTDGYHGLASNKPPTFDGTKYDFWKNKMKLHLKSINFHVWKITESPYEVPTTDEDKWGELDKKNDNNNARAMNALYGALSESEYSRIRCFNTAHQIWKSLESLHEGTSHVKENKLIHALAKYENFIMGKDESISEMNSRFTCIVNDLAGLGEPISEKNQVRKLLRSLPDKYYSKRNAIQEAHDISDLSVVELCGNLMAYENERFTSKEKEEKKDIALKSKAESENSSDDDDLAMLTNNFKNFLRKSRNLRDHKSERYHKTNHKQGSRSHSSKAEHSKEPVCFKCNKSGHIKLDCPTLKSKDTAHQVDWSDSESDSDFEDCLMALESDSEVNFSDSKFNSLEEAFLDLANKYKSEKQLAKSLRIECMHRSTSSNENELENIRKNCMILEESNSRLSKKIEKQESKISILKEQNFALLEHFEALDSDTSSSCDQIENLELEISEINNLHAKQVLETTNEISMLKEKLCEKEKDIESLSSHIHALSEESKTKEKEFENISSKYNTLQKYTKGAEMLDNMLENSRSGKIKFGLGFDPTKTLDPKLSKNPKIYKTCFVKESNPIKINHIPKTPMSNHVARKTHATKRVILPSPTRLYSRKKWMTKHELKSYKLVRNVNFLGPKDVWVPKNLSISPGNKDVNMVVRQRVYKTHDWRQNTTIRHNRNLWPQEGQVRRQQ